MFGAALLVQTFLATSAFAIPPSKEPLGARIARRASSVPLENPIQVGNWTSVVSDNPHVRTSEIWAGAVQEAEKSSTQAFSSVTGTFTIPTIQIPPGSSGTHAIAPWVGIDGVVCEDVILYSALELIIQDTADSTLQFVAVCGWYPADPVIFDDFAAHVGDLITLSVNATSPTSGAATIINHTTGKTASHSFSGQPALCQKNAQWMVEDTIDVSTNAPIPIAKWDTLTYTNASATTDSLGTVSPYGATIVEMWQNDTVLAVALAEDSSVTIEYTGP